MYSPLGPVLIIAPPTLYRQGLLLTLQHAWPALDCTLTADACHALDLLREQSYRLVVVDGLLSDPPLPTLLERLFMTRANQQLLLLTGQRLSPTLRQSLQAIHHLALVPRHALPEAVMVVVEHLLEEEQYRGFAANPFLHASHHGGPATPFSRRELEVLRLVVADCCNQQIAEQLNLSVRTVESHRRALLQKTGARTLVGLVVQAVRDGWIAA
jgi:DNA-binding NarL/FixJ family response regulator